MARSNASTGYRALRCAALLALLGSGAVALATLPGDDDKPAREVTRPGKPLKPAEIDETLAIGGEELDARKLRSRMTVTAHVNDAGPYRFVVDSGADSSVVSRAVAAALKLPMGSPITLNGMTETRRVDRVQIASLLLGNTRFEDLEIPVLEQGDIGGDGMIGLDALVQQRLMMDFERRVVTIDDATVPVERSPDEIVVIGRLQRGQLILTSVRAERTTVDAVIDTGSEITIGNRALRDQMMRKHSKNLKTVRIYGVTGAAADLELMVVSTLRIGPVTLTNVPIAFADVPPFTVFGLNDKPSLLLGTDVMENFRRVSLDFHERKARFQLRKCGDSAVTLRTTTLASRLSGTLESACAR